MDGDASASDLDPRDWDAFARVSHAALDMMIAHVKRASLGEGPAWRAPSAGARAAFDTPLPRKGTDLAALLDTVRDHVLPYGTGNLHPMFCGWVHGAGTPYGMVGELLAAGLNANCGGRDHIAIDVERQIARWAAALFSYPEHATGLFLTGTSIANFVGLMVARDAALGHTIRQTGLAGAPQLTAYASDAAHGCIRQAVELAGLGSDHLRRIATTANGGIDVGALRDAIAADRRAGLRPFLVVGTAGSVNTGAIDDLDALADVARDDGLWFHVDGAFGALLAVSSVLSGRLKGIERSDSVAFDFHKWAHVPYDAGFLLVRDGEMHRDTFAHPDAYLQRTPRGTGAGAVWPSDLGPDLSRGFRALKTWLTLQALGADRIARSIETCCELAADLERRLVASSVFEPAAPVGLNIVCFRLREGRSAERHAWIVMELQERGIAVPSLTTLDGETVIRVAFVNHRTTGQHVARLVAAAEAIAGEVA